MYIELWRICFLSRLLRNFDFPEMKFSLFFMGYCKEEDMPKDEAERIKWTFRQPATIELT